MRLGKKRSYISEDRMVRATLTIHQALTDKYRQEGALNPSQQAYDEILDGKHAKAIRNKAEEIKQRNRRKNREED